MTEKICLDLCSIPDRRSLQSYRSPPSVWSFHSFESITRNSLNMHSPSTLAVVSALAGSALAQSTSVTSLFLYGFEGENIVASVVAAAPAATTYFVGCAPGTDSTDCGFGPGLNFVEGPSTLGLHFTEDGAL